MKHTLRKFISCRGSALIMVLGTMFALLVAVMAMYFSVVSSRSVQYAVFNQEQSYQSALSLQNAMIGGFSDGTMRSVLEHITKDTFKEGDVYATTVGGTEADEVNGVGHYEVAITRVKDDVVNGNKVLTFDVATTVEVNGILETTHIFYHVYPQIDETTTGNSQIFAATGYVPNGVNVTSGHYGTTSSFDNEIVNVGNANTFNTAEYKLSGNFYCGGSLAFYKGNNAKSEMKKAIDVVVRDTAYFYNIGSTLYLAPDNYKNSQNQIEKGNLYVGKDLYIYSGFKVNADNLYILGDVYVYGGEIQFENNSKLHVDGKIFLYDGAKINGQDKVEVNKGVFVCGSDGSITQDTSYSYANWDNDSANAAVAYIKSTTDTCSFKEWELPKDLKYDTHKKDIIFNAKNNEYTVEIPFVEHESKKCYTKIGDIKNTANPDNGVLNNFTIYIDTGDDPYNIHYIKLTKNCKVGDPVNARTDDATEKAGYNGFTWFPKGVDTLAGDQDYEHKNMHIIVKGRGSVVVDAEDVIYIPSPQEMFLHESWAYLLNNGAIETKDGSGNVIQTKFKTKGNHNTARNYIHVDCSDGDGCNYQVDDLTTEKCSKCNSYLKKITCAQHNYEWVGCTNASCDEGQKAPDKNALGKYYGLCENRIDRTKVDNSGVNLPKDASGNVYYPNNNIFLVSNKESAEIYISDYAWVEDPTTGEGATQAIPDSSFFGFIYAPYMTYNGISSAQNEVFRFCGGMVVSDYNFADDGWYLSCYPDLMPEQLGATKDLPSVDKQWKVEVARN